MKKLRIIAAILCLSIFTCAAMASGSESSSDESKKVVAASEEASNDEEASEEETTTTEAAHEVTIEEQVLVDQDDVVITALEYVSDGFWGDGIKLNIQNNTNRNIMVGCTALIVNNYMITDLFATDVAAGMQANETLYLSSSELRAAGIENVGKVEVYFHVYDDDTWEDIFNTDCITIETSDYENMDIIALDDGFELYNQDGIRIVGKTVDENSFWGTAILLYIENTSGRNVGISVEHMAINSFMMTPVFSSTVYNDRMAIDDITIFSSELEENGITSIEEVSLTFHIYDTDSYSTICDTDPIVFSAN